VVVVTGHTHGASELGSMSSGSREQGKVARDFFTEWKTVYIDPPAS
jgi:hypothetical protein